MVYTAVRRHLYIGIFALLAFSIVFVARELPPILWLNLSGAMDRDAAIYVTVGRGILNGLRPYADLFESKPPVVYLIMAFSLLVSGGTLLASVLSCVCFLLPIVGFPLYAYRNSRGNGDLWSSFLVAAVGISLGTLLTLYWEGKSSALQTEVFAVGASLSYFFTLLGDNEGRRLQKHDILRVLFLFLAGFTREPVLISTVAGALLLIPREKLLRRLVLPILAAGLLGIFLLLVLGWAPAFFHSYLPAMLHGRVEASNDTPLFLRVFTVRRLYAEMIAYNKSSLIFGYMIAVFALLYSWMKSDDLVHASRYFVLSAVATLLALLAVFFAEAPVIVWYLKTVLGADVVYIPLTSMVIRALLCMGGIAVIAYVEGVGKILHSVGPLTVSIMLGALAIGTGDYSGNHYAFAVPLYAALCLCFLGFAASNPQSLLLPAVGLLASLACVTYAPSPDHLTYLHDQLLQRKSVHAGQVQKVDGLMDACGYDRYINVGTVEMLAFARHSPAGPLVVPQFHSYLPPDHPLKKATARRTMETSIIISANEDMLQKDYAPILPAFTDTPPDCASPFLPIEGIRVLFRK